jgi:hypothetical protein
MPLKLHNESAWRTRDIRSILLVGMRAHDIKHVSAGVIADGAKFATIAPISAWMRIVLPARVGDIGIAGVWLPHECDDDLQARVAKRFAAQVDSG